MNRKRFFLVFVALLIITACIFIFLKMKDPALQCKQRLPATVKLKLFQGSNPPFDFTFEYPEAWKAGENKLSKVSMVEVLGSQDEITKVIPGIFIKVKKINNEESLLKQIDAILQREGRFSKFKKLRHENVQIGKASGLRVSFQYVLPLPMRAPHPQNKVLRREEVLLARNGKTYQISFWVTDEQYQIYRLIFEHILQTFQFVD